VNEFELIARFFSRSPRAASVHLSVGDDAALLAPTPGCELAVAVDMLVGGRHFFADTDPERLGHKALAVNLSDIAAMGATPRWALLAGALPDGDAAWVAAFARGFYALADAHGVDLVGGDTTRGPLNLCVTIMGEVPEGRALLRSGAKPGDDVYVSGALGDAALAVAAMTGRTRLGAEALLAARARLEMPAPRIALGLALRGVATAAIDVSDGLLGDLGHILERSAVGATVDLPAIPRSPALAHVAGGAAAALALECLLAGGDDYELCFTAPRAAADRIAAIGARTALPLARIGAITAGPGLVVRDGRGVPLPALPRAYDHFGA
jgi:thiamine-monophosphate kinase